MRDKFYLISSVRVYVVTILSSIIIRMKITTQYFKLNMSGLKWVSSNSRKPVPNNAVVGGRDSDGSTIYVGRSNFRGEQLPCKLVPQRQQAYVSHSRSEHVINNYEVLCEPVLQWIPNTGGRIPPGAVPGGRTQCGETLYVGRTRHANSQTVGKVHPSHGCLYIPFGGMEHSYKTYEILVLK